MTDKKRRIAVLGGGLGSLAAVHALTELPDWQDRFELTVYQIGWRLGGKARSGRNARAHNRSESFGHQVWWGCYDNAFALLRRCYKSLGRPPAAPLSTFRAAWKPAETLHIATGLDDHARLWPLSLAGNDALPGDGVPPPSVWHYVEILLPWILDCIPGLHPDLSSYALLAPHWQDQARALLPALLRRASGQGVTTFAAFDPTAPDYDALLRQPAPTSPLGSRQRRAWAQPLVVGAEQSLRVLEAAGAATLHPQFVPLLDLALAIVRGIIHDGLDRSALGFSAADDHDLRAWLRHHGASASSVANPLLNGFYAILHAYRDGDPERPALAAGAGLRLLLRALLAHRGALYYTPQADLGEVVFAPLYQLLRRRGVRFRFFHKVKQLRTDGEHLTAIRLGRQVELDPGVDEYEPLVTVKGIPCWPSRPLYGQIVLGDSPLIQALDFESPDSPEIEEFTLRRGADFDEVILGIPGPALPRVCAELSQQLPRWREALEHADATATIGAQLWLTPSWAQLAGHTTAVGAGALPGASLPRWANRSALIPHEAWTRDAWPATLAALDGPLPDTTSNSQPSSRELVRDTVSAWLRDHPRRLWPEAALAATRELNWELLQDPSGRTGEHRLAAQHCWILGAPSDRHTLSLPGSSRHRLRPDDSGLKNLVLAGDWLTGGLDLGIAESAVIAGLQAARALSGEALQICGERDGVDVDLSVEPTAAPLRLAAST
jgi:uncharacterized protein with NAD-binding domain and iron-sulfur cluster